MNDGNQALFMQDQPVEALPCVTGDIGGAGLKTIRLTPDGESESKNGNFVVDDESARLVIAAFDKHGTLLPIDYEHQTLAGQYASRDGKAPAAGWIHKIWHERGRGLMALVEWNEKARDMIRVGEYRYLSPVVVVRKSDRKVVAIHSAAITNTPAIGHMDMLAASTQLPQKEDEMAEHNPAETERLIGEIRALLVEKGVEIEAAEDRNGILRAAIATLKGKSPEDSGETKEDDAAIASSVRARLGLAADAGKNEVLLKFSLADAGGSRTGNAEAELKAMKGADADRRAKELVDQHVIANRINRNDTTQYESALALAKENPERFEQIMGATQPLIPAGKTNAPSGQTTQRDSVIVNASREFDDNPELGKLTTKTDHVNLALMESKQASLSEEEVKTFAVA